MDFEDLMGISDIGSYIPAEAGFITVVGIIFALGLVAAAIAFVGVTRRNIGRKAGLSKDWMAYVPFARTVYLLSVVGEEWWKMFFLEYIWLYPLIISWFFNLFNNSTMSTFGYILSVLYFLAQIGYKIYFRTKFYKAFNMKGEFALGTGTIWGFFFLHRVFECIIAFTNLIEYGSVKSGRPTGQVASPMQSSPVSAPPYSGSASYSLSGLTGMFAGQEIPISVNDDLIIGRDAAYSNIIIDTNAAKVSRKHCVVRFDTTRNTYMVTDHSTNGTYIDGGGRLVVNVPTPLARGAIIALGNRENRFRLN